MHLTSDTFARMVRRNTEHTTARTTYPYQKRGSFEMQWLRLRWAKAFFLFKTNSCNFIFTSVLATAPEIPKPRKERKKRQNEQILLSSYCIEIYFTNLLKVYRKAFNHSFNSFKLSIKTSFCHENWDTIITDAWKWKFNQRFICFL